MSLPSRGCYNNTPLRATDRTDNEMPSAKRGLRKRFSYQRCHQDDSLPREGRISQWYTLVYQDCIFSFIFACRHACPNQTDPMRPNPSQLDGKASVRHQPEPTSSNRCVRCSTDNLAELLVARPHFRSGSRLCKNYFLTTETKYWFMKLAFATTMIRPRDLPDSIVAQLVPVSAFLHSLDP